MKISRLILSLIVAIVAIGCRTGSDAPSYFVTQDGDSISTNYLIGERRVGKVDRGATVNSLFKRYGENYVKQLKDPSQEFKRDSSVVATYYVYNKQNNLLMIARCEASTTETEVRSLILKDPRFATEKGITINSTVEQVREAYPDAMMLEYDGRFFVFVSSLDMYLRVNEDDIAGYDPNFVAEIPIDSLDMGAHFENISVNWDSHNTDILTSQFWHDLISKILRWLVYKLPVVLFIIVIFIISKKLLSFFFKKIATVTRRRLAAEDSLDSSEAVKRVDTITGILHGVLNILLWGIFVLILLSKFNINIAPILASAGIIGLAVGFGAQELVRDFISGFFIILEDQLRTGDMAIINDTMGEVEKIELRTVTLRDASGVVHIFQNGKINSLSNMTKEWSAIVLEIGVAYKEDVDRVMHIMKEVGAELREGRLGNLMLGDIEVWGLDSFADSAIVIKMVIKTRPMKQWRIKREYQRLLKIRFDAEGIEIPFPHVTLYTGEKTKPMPIDLTKD